MIQNDNQNQTDGIKHQQEGKPEKQMPMLIAAVSGIVLGVAAAFAPFIFDDISYRSSAISIIGCIYFFLIIALVLSAMIRLGGVLLSKRVRCLVTKHPIAHLIWIAFGFGVIIGILILMFFGPTKK